MNRRVACPSRRPRLSRADRLWWCPGGGARRGAVLPRSVGRTVRRVRIGVAAAVPIGAAAGSAGTALPGGFLGLHIDGHRKPRTRIDVDGRFARRADLIRHPAG